MEKVEFPTYEAMLSSESALVKQLPTIHLEAFRSFHYLQIMAHCFGFVFYTFFLFLFLVHGKTFLTFEHTFKSIYILQIFTFGAALVTQKIYFQVSNIEYYTFDTFSFLPKFLLSLCDKLVTAQMPVYWFVIAAFLVIQIAEFSNQNTKAVKFAHIYLIPIAFIIFLFSMNSPSHMEVVMSVLCFLIWWIYRKHMVARLYSQDMTHKDNLNLRRLNIWLSVQIFSTILFHLLKLGVTLIIKSSVIDSTRQIYFFFCKDLIFQGFCMFGTYSNAMLFAWSTINFIKSDHTSSPAEQSTLPVFVGGSVPMEPLSRRPSTISAFSSNNVAPMTPRDPNMLHI